MFVFGDPNLNFHFPLLLEVVLHPNYINAHKSPENPSITHTIHVRYICLHLVDFCGKCRQIYRTWMVWVRAVQSYLAKC